MPFVALYAGSTLKGCIGSDEGTGGEKLARAFLSSLGDVRFGGIRRHDRRGLVAEVSYVRAPRMADRSTLESVFEVGTHGLALHRERGMPVVLLPSVARDGRLGPTGMLEALDRKAGPEAGSLVLFETDTVVVRRTAWRGREMTPTDAAAEWLASLIRPDGSIAFAKDARTGETVDIGEMHHARGASVVQALERHGGYPRKVVRARARLTLECRAALRGDAPPGWPADAARVAGTLALAVRAGVPIEAEARAYVSEHAAAIAAVPWHAAQVVAALGKSAPEALWQASVRDLGAHPWAPWTIFAALGHGDQATATGASHCLVDAIRTEAPYRGSVMLTRTPEVALTALTIEALRAVAQTPAIRRAVRRGQDFLRRCQMTRDLLPGPFTPGPSLGAFSATPTSSLLRGDVTAHALLALF